MTRTAQFSFFETITLAIQDMAANGFDSEGRMAKWVRLIREAAVREMRSEDLLDRDLKRLLTAAYQRAVERGGVWKYHPEISAITKAAVKPKLRAELDRRMATSRNLIRLNRERAIRQTEQRFIGWATSIPAGGSDTIEKRPVKMEIRKALTQLPFEERRVLIDQGHKLISSVSNIIATDGGAIAVIWHSHWRDPSYRFRPDHKERDLAMKDGPYAIKGNWAIERGLMKPGPNGYYEDVTAFGEEIFCFPGHSKIPHADGVEKVYRRWYSGQVLTLTTASGKVLTGTPNHPILTVNGWKSLSSLNESDHVIEVADQVFGAAKKNQNQAIPTIAEIFGALDKRGISHSSDDRPAQFHGDGTVNGQVDTVFSAWPLQFSNMATNNKGIHQFLLAKSYGGLSFGGSFQELGLGLLFAAQGFMSGLSQLLAARWPQALHSDFVGAGNAPQIGPGFLYSLGDSGSRHAAFLGQCQDALARLILSPKFGVIQAQPAGRLLSRAEIKKAALVTFENGHGGNAQGLSNFLQALPFGTQASRVIKINSHSFSGHVYNLQTLGGWYVTEGILTHNCRCYGQYLYGIRQLPDEMLTEKGRAMLKRADEL